jgi:hypothetical protein
MRTHLQDRTRVLREVIAAYWGVAHVPNGHAFSGRYVNTLRAATMSEGGRYCYLGHPIRMLITLVSGCSTACTK